MQFCSSAGSVLILLLMIFITGSESGVHVVKVEYGVTAVLPCTDTCTGVVSWTPSHKATDILAECDQTSCRSVKEGYQMIHDQYLQGDFSLIITEADYSKRGYYTCDCDGTDKCDVDLQIEAWKTSLQIESGDSLLMKLEVSDPVEVIYSSTGAAAGSSVQICTVFGDSLQCKSKYKHRTSLLSSSSSVLELRDMKVSDSGVYTIRIVGNKGDIHIYSVTVKGSESGVLVVKVENKGTAFLHCTERCSGAAIWTPAHNSTDILAKCDQTSCRSMKEGFHMIHDHYWEGNLFLIITEADYSKRGRYTCDCDGTGHCDVELQIEPPIIPVEMESGDSLVMKFDVSDPVEVIYYSTAAADGFSGQICTVIGGSLQCESKYKHSTCLSSSSSVLELRDMKVSDSGIYIIRDIRNNEDIHIYTVIMSEGWSLLDIVLLIIVAFLCGMLVGMCRRKKCPSTKKQNDSNQEMKEMI